MAIVRQIRYNSGISIGASETRYLFLDEGTQSTNDTESKRTSIHRTAGVFSNLQINVTANDRAATTFRTRKGTADANLLITVTGSTTGLFEDNSNTDTVTAGDDWHARTVGGSGGTVFTYRIASVLFSATTNTVKRFNTTWGANLSTASTAYPHGMFSSSSNTPRTESDIQIKSINACSLKNLCVYVVVNTRSTTTTYRTRVNGSNGNLLVSATASTTGTLEDTSNTDSLSAGDLVNFLITTGTGTGNVGHETIACDWESTDETYQFINGSNAGVTFSTLSTTYFFASAGTLNTGTTESDVQGEANVAVTLSKMECYVKTNTITAASTLRLRKNSADGNQVVSVTASTTGLFTDSSNSDAIVATDTTNYSFTTGGTGTSIILNSVTILASPTAAAGTTWPGYIGGGYF